MPYIQIKANISIDKEQEKRIKQQLGEKITILPGKSENWLMVCIEQNSILYFQGDKSQPAAFVEVSLFGKADSSAYNKMTAAVCTMFEQILSISPSRIFVKYMEVPNWGWNGGNF